jgi:hypothetical protein
MKEICVHLIHPWSKYTVCSKEKSLVGLGITSQSEIYI